MSRLFVTGLNGYNGCNDESPSGKCVVLGAKVWREPLLGEIRVLAEGRRHLVPEFGPMADVIAAWPVTASWDCLDDAGAAWTLFSHVAMFRAVFGDFNPAQRTLTRNWWWLDDELPRDAFFVVTRDEALQQVGEVIA